jgi:dienelactone hydrolase
MTWKLFSHGVVTATTVLSVAGSVAGSLAGCAGSGPPATKPSAPATGASASPSPTGPRPAGTRCPALVASATQVRFPNAAGGQLAGVMLGTGATGVVLAHQSRGNVCEWMPYAPVLTAAGYRVLAFDFTGEGASPPGSSDPAADVAAAVTFLRGQGVTKVAMMGASKGGVAVVGAAAAISPPVAAAVCVSGPRRFQGVDAVAAAPQIKAPVFYVAARDDGSFAADAQAMYDRTPAATRSILVVEGRSHGVGLLGVDERVRAAVADFLRRHAPL